MAKQKPLQKKDAEQVWVESKTYKGHWRAKRGSKTEAKLNTALQKSTEDLKIANKAAQLIKASIDPFREDFMGGLLWQDLVKKFKQQINKGEEFNTLNLKNTEIWARYPMSRFGTCFTSKLEISHCALKLSLSINQHPNFKRSFTDSYRLSVLAIFPNFKTGLAATECCIADTIFMNSEVKSMVFTFKIPKAAVHYLLVLKVEGADKGNIDANITIKAMRIIEAGLLT